MAPSGAFTTTEKIQWGSGPMAEDHWVPPVSGETSNECFWHLRPLRPDRLVTLAAVGLANVPAARNFANGSPSPRGRLSSTLQHHRTRKTRGRELARRGGRGRRATWEGRPCPVACGPRLIVPGPCLILSGPCLITRGLVSTLFLGRAGSSNHFSWADGDCLITSGPCLIAV